jgi:hypothetical protein
LNPDPDPGAKNGGEKEFLLKFFSFFKTERQEKPYYKTTNTNTWL